MQQVSSPTQQALSSEEYYKTLTLHPSTVTSSVKQRSLAVVNNCCLSRSQLRSEKKKKKKIPCQCILSWVCPPRQAFMRIWFKNAQRAKLTNKKQTKQTKRNKHNAFHEQSLAQTPVSVTERRKFLSVREFWQTAVLEWQDKLTRTKTMF